MEAFGKYNIWMKAPIILLLMFQAMVSNGQKQVLHQKQIWFKYYLRLPVGENWQIRQEVDDRNFLDPARQSQFLSRTFVQRKIDNAWSVALGFAYFKHSLPQEPEVQDYYNVPELRPSFEISNHSHISDKFELHHRYWTEFRFFKQPEEAYAFATIRIRYKLELRYALSEKFSFLAFDEVHFNVGNKITYNVFDQNRYGIAAMYSPVENVGFEIMYINWFQQAAQGDLFYDRDILRVAVHHRLDWFNQPDQGQD